MPIIIDSTKEQPGAATVEDILKNKEGSEKQAKLLELQRIFYEVQNVFVPLESREERDRHYKCNAVYDEQNKKYNVTVETHTSKKSLEGFAKNFSDMVFDEIGKPAALKSAHFKYDISEGFGVNKSDVDHKTTVNFILSEAVVGKLADIHKPTGEDKFSDRNKLAVYILRSICDDMDRGI